jgi:hypothetical protein
LPFEGAIRDPPLTLEHGSGLRQHLFERHNVPPCLGSLSDVTLHRAYLIRTADGTPCREAGQG